MRSSLTPMAGAGGLPALRRGQLEGVVRDLALVGGGLQLLAAGRAPLVESVSFNTGLIVGPDVLSYTVGMGLSL